MTLLNAFDLPFEENITASNYEAAFDRLNSSYPDIIRGLDIKTCDMQNLLSEVTTAYYRRQDSRASVLWLALILLVLAQGVEGTGLAFIVFTEAITKMPGAPAWSVLFFIMLLCLGLSTLFGNIEGVVVPLKDLKLFPQRWPQEALTGISSKHRPAPVSRLLLLQHELSCFFAYFSGTTCAVAFIISLLFAQQSGIYWVTLFDNFAGSVPLLTTGLFEMIAVVYFYGIDRLAHDTNSRITPRAFSFTARSQIKLHIKTYNVKPVVWQVQRGLGVHDRI